MDHYAGIDVSLECSSVSVVDAKGKIVREAQLASEPEALIAWFRSLGFDVAGIGFRAPGRQEMASWRSISLALYVKKNRDGLSRQKAQVLL